MRRYLIFDECCSVCNSLAETIKKAAGDKIESLSIYDTKAKTLLDQAYPEGWEHAPYLVTVEQGTVHAWRGIQAALYLGRLMGPRQTWRIWTLARQHGISWPFGSSKLPTHFTSRRQFLRVGLTASLVAVAVRLGWPASLAFACIPCLDCGETCILGQVCYTTGEVCGSSFKSDYADKYDCYDNRSGEYCYSLLQWHCDLKCI